MREKEFMEMAKQEILRQLPEDVRNGLSLKEVEVVKINDQKNHGFCFQKDGSKASTTLYLDHAYDLFRQILGSREKSLEPLFLWVSLKYQRFRAFHQTAHRRILKCTL